MAQDLEFSVHHQKCSVTVKSQGYALWGFVMLEMMCGSLLKISVADRQPIFTFILIPWHFPCIPLSPNRWHSLWFKSELLKLNLCKSSNKLPGSKYLQVSIPKKMNSLIFYSICKFLLCHWLDNCFIISGYIPTFISYLFLFPYALDRAVIQMCHRVNFLPISWLFHAAKDQISSIPAILDLNRCTVGVIGENTSPILEC